jgi:hypothetical protein
MCVGEGGHRDGHSLGSDLNLAASLLRISFGAHSWLGGLALEIIAKTFEWLSFGSVLELEK